jgi:CelD/BcsL family acetyltransferase involved in cellulose biosynthesis
MLWARRERSDTAERDRTMKGPGLKDRRRLSDGKEGARRGSGVVRQVSSVSDVSYQQNRVQAFARKRRSSAKLAVEFVSTRDMDERDVAAWAALVERAVEPNPFFEPAFVLPALRYLEQGSSVRLLVVRDGLDLRFLAPVTKNRFWGHPRLLTTWNHPICYLHTPLVDSDTRLGPEAWRLAIRAIRRSAWRASVTSIPSDGPAIEMLRTAASEEREWWVDELHERAFLRRQGTFADFTESMSGHRRRELNRGSRKLEAVTGGPVAAIDVTGAGGVEEFLRLELAGWKGQAGTAVGSKPGTRELFEAMCRNFDEQGRLLVMALHTQRGPAAAIVCVRAGSTLFSLKMSYDEGLRDCSPGVRLVHDLVRHFYLTEELTGIDSCADPSSTFVNQIFPDRISIASLSVRSSRPAARPVVTVTRATTRTLRKAASFR